MICHLRTHNECGCAPGTCQQRPRAIPAPLIRPTNTDIYVLWVFCIVIAVIVGGTVQALRAEEIQHQLEARV